MDLNGVIESVVGWITTSGVRLLVAAILLVAGFKIINITAKRLENKATGVKGDKTVARVLAYGVRIGLKLALLLALVGFVGIDTGGLAALAASLGVSVGLALNGALSNLAGGVLIITTRPFRVDDYIEAEGHSGTVVDIHVTHTRLRTPDNKIVYLPNGALSGADIVNYSESPRRRLDVDVTVSYLTDLAEARKCLLEIAASAEKILADPPPEVKTTAIASDGVTLSLRMWVLNRNYWDVKFAINECVCYHFEKNILLPPAKHVTLPDNRR